MGTAHSDWIFITFASCDPFKIQLNEVVDGWFGFVRMPMLSTVPPPRSLSMCRCLRHMWMNSRSIICRLSQPFLLPSTWIASSSECKLFASSRLRANFVIRPVGLKSTNTTNEKISICWWISFSLATHRDRHRTKDPKIHRGVARSDCSPGLFLHGQNPRMENLMKTDVAGGFFFRVYFVNNERWTAQGTFSGCFARWISFLFACFSSWICSIFAFLQTLNAFFHLSYHTYVSPPTSNEKPHKILIYIL